MENWQVAKEYIWISRKVFVVFSRRFKGYILFMEQKFLKTYLQKWREGNSGWREFWMDFFKGELTWSRWNEKFIFGPCFGFRLKITLFELAHWRRRWIFGGRNRIELNTTEHQEGIRTLSFNMPISRFNSTTNTHHGTDYFVHRPEIPHPSTGKRF